jgi:dTDP-4-amino-4,6-dideoxygalactose transaminase
MSWFESNQSYAIIRKIYSFIFSLRKKKADNLSSYNEELKRFVKKSHPYFLRYFASRIKKMENWQKQRFEKGIKLYKALREKELLNNYSSLDIVEHSSFTKFFIYHPKIETDKLMRKLNMNGIEVKHLEHKQIPQVQERFDRFENDGSLASCVNYHLVHDSLISLPLHEGISDKEINFIVQNLSQQIYE